MITIWWHGLSPRLGALCLRVLYNRPCPHCGG